MSFLPAQVSAAIAASAPAAAAAANRPAAGAAAAAARAAAAQTPAQAAAQNAPSVAPAHVPVMAWNPDGNFYYDSTVYDANGNLLPTTPPPPPTTAVGLDGITLYDPSIFDAAGNYLPGKAPAILSGSGYGGAWTNTNLVLPLIAQKLKLTDPTIWDQAMNAYFSATGTSGLDQAWWGDQAATSVYLQGLGYLDPAKYGTVWDTFSKIPAVYNPALEAAQQNQSAQVGMAAQAANGGGDIFSDLLPILAIAGAAFGGVGLLGLLSEGAVAGLSAADALIAAGGAEALGGSAVVDAIAASGISAADAAAAIATAAPDVAASAAAAGVPVDAAIAAATPAATEGGLAALGQSGAATGQGGLSSIVQAVTDAAPSLSGVAKNVAINAAGQLITTGDINPDQLLTSALTGVAGSTVGNMVGSAVGGGLASTIASSAANAATQAAINGGDPLSAALTAATTSGLGSLATTVAQDAGINLPRPIVNAVVNSVVTGAPITSGLTNAALGMAGNAAMNALFPNSIVSPATPDIPTVDGPPLASDLLVDTTVNGLPGPIEPTFPSVGDISGITPFEPTFPSVGDISGTAPFEAAVPTVGDISGVTSGLSTLDPNAVPVGDPTLITDVNAPVVDNTPLGDPTLITDVTAPAADNTPIGDPTLLAPVTDTTPVGDPTLITDVNAPVADNTPVGDPTLLTPSPDVALGDPTLIDPIVDNTPVGDPTLITDVTDPASDTTTDTSTTGGGGIGGGGGGGGGGGTRPATGGTSPATGGNTVNNSTTNVTQPQKPTAMLEFLSPLQQNLIKGSPKKETGMFTGLSPEQVALLTAAASAPTHNDMYSYVPIDNDQIEFAHGGLAHLAEGGDVGETNKKISDILAEWSKPTHAQRESRAAASSARLDFLPFLKPNMLRGRAARPDPMFSGLKLAEGGGIDPHLADVLASRNFHINSELVPGPENRMYAKHAHRGFAVGGPGTGQSDDIPTMLSDGEYVIDADTVAALGDGSSKAGASILDKFRQEIRKHKRSAHVNDIPPKAKNPMQYLKMAQKGK